jgi:sugar/nucleoside kinase (ribokinase family)
MGMPEIMTIVEPTVVDQVNVLPESAGKHFASHYAKHECDDANKALDPAYKLTNGACVAVTLGEKGILRNVPSCNLEHLPSRRVNGLNTLGAGDVFHGACAFSLKKNSCFETAVTFE